MHNQTISELYIHDNQSKHSRKPTDILKSAKQFLWKTLYQTDTATSKTCKTATTEFIRKIPNRKEMSNEQLHPFEAKNI